MISNTDQSKNGVVVQLVRIPACHAGGRGFEPRPLRQKEEEGPDNVGPFFVSTVRVFPLRGVFLPGGGNTDWGSKGFPCREIRGLRHVGEPRPLRQKEEEGSDLSGPFSIPRSECSPCGNTDPNTCILLGQNNRVGRISAQARIRRIRQIGR